MKIEIDESYINWLKEKMPEIFNQEHKDMELDVAFYINEALISHMNSWKEDDED